MSSKMVYIGNSFKLCGYKDIHTFGLELSKLCDVVKPLVLERASHISKGFAIFPNTSFYEMELLADYIGDMTGYTFGDLYYLDRTGTSVPDTSGTHHPECTCFECAYGSDAYKFNFNPSEY